MQKNICYLRASNQKGFSLIEVMIGLILGLFVILAAGQVFMASKKTTDFNAALGRIQEAGGLSFEMMARDFREAGANPCSSEMVPGSILNNRDNAWWSQWNGGLYGYTSTQNTPGISTGSSAGSRLAGTDAVDIYSALGDSNGGIANVVSKMASPSADIQISANSGFSTGDIAIICDLDTAFLFQATQVNGTAIQHAAGSGAPGNCGKLFMTDGTCSNGTTGGYQFNPSSMIARTSITRWYVGKNEDGGNSLYRAQLRNTGNNSTPTLLERVEVVAGVSNLKIQYSSPSSSDYQNADSVTDWKTVKSIRIRLTLEDKPNAQTEAGIGDSGKGLVRNLTHIVSLRNRQ